MLPRIERLLADWIASGARGIGQVLIVRQGEGFLLCHRDDEGKTPRESFCSPHDARAIARFDNEGNFRPLKTAPNLRHGWRLELANLTQLSLALNFFYPGRLAVLVAWEKNCLTTTPLRETLNRQSGMYRVAAKISDGEINQLVGNFCRSRGGNPGCLRTILWPRDATQARPSMLLPLDKFIAPLDQTGREEKVLPLLCQEACHLFVAAAREVVRPPQREDN